MLTSPQNPSFHPIQTAGKNLHIDPNAFNNGMTADTVITCTDCHSSDDPNLRGPHASMYQYILKKPSTTTTFPAAMPQDDICFDCHAYAVYGDPSSPVITQKASRFNAPAAQGHVFHVGSQHIPCYLCHESHGSTRFPALIATRLRGVTGFMQTPTGGTCSGGCHTARTYTLNYPR